MAAFLPAPTITVPIGQPRTKIMVLHCSPNHSLSLKALFPRLDTLTLDTKKLANCFKPCSVCAQACASSLSATALQSHKDSEFSTIYPIFKSQTVEDLGSMVRL
jgi:hypothetical protein